MLYAKEAAFAASESEAVERTFINLSGGAEKAAQNMAALRRATKNLASETAQQQIANQLLGMSIVSTADEMEKVVGISRRLGKEFRGLNAKQAAEEFALMISNMSVARLDSFGISSGKVRARIKELMETTEGMTREQAFFQATMEEGEKVLGRLGPETETLADEMAELSAKTADFQAAFGALISDGGTIGFMADLVGFATDAAIKLDDIAIAIKAVDKLSTERAARGGGFAETLEDINQKAKPFLAIANPMAFVMDKIVGVTANATLAGDEFAETIKEIKDTAAAVTPIFEDNTEAIEDNTEALEEQAAHLEEVAAIRRDFARELISIDEQTQDDIAETWDDYFDDEADAWKRTQKRIQDIKKDAAKDLVRIDRDLQKDLAKEGESLAKSLSRLNSKEQQDIKRAQEKVSKTNRNESKRRNIDALADKRLFDFELRNLAAAGEGNRIREMIERRAIEEEIAREKAAVEGEIETEKQTDEIERIKETASTRRSELQQDSAERRSLLQEEAVEEKESRQAELAEKLADEAASFKERIEELRQYRDEKLTNIEASKQEAIAALGRELAEIGDLTAKELAELIPVAGKLGEESGKAFADGLTKGFETNQRISTLLGSNIPQISQGPGGGRGTVGFQHGGSFTVGGSGGPDSQLVQFKATPGEQVSVGNGGGITININNPAFGGAVDQAEVNAFFQEFTDTVLTPLLSN